MKRVFFLLFLLVPLAISAQSGRFSGGSDEALFQDAENRLNAGDYLLAEELYRRLILSYPLSAHQADAQFRIGQVKYNLGDFEEALAQLDLVSRRYASTKYRALLPFWKGMSYYRLGRYGEAHAHFSEYLGEAPSALRDEALLYDSLALKALGRFPEARPYLEELYRREDYAGDKYYILVLLGNLYLQAEDYDGLKALVAGSPDRDIPKPWDDHVLFFQAESFLASGDRQQARRLYQELTGGPESLAGAAYLRLFHLAQEEGQTEGLTDLINAAEISLRNQPEVLKNFWLRVGVEFYKQNRYADAEFYLRRVWNDPAKENLSPLVPLYLAKIAGSQGDWQRGLNYVTAYMEISALEREWLLYTKGELLVRGGRWDEAGAVWGEFFADYPLSALTPYASYYSAYSFYKLGKNREALEQTLSLNLMQLDGEQRQGVLKLKARLYNRLGEYNAAETAWKDYLRLYPEDYQARAEALKNSFFAGDYETVIAEYLVLSRQIASAGDEALAIMAAYFTGLAHISMGNWTSALETLMPLTEERLARADMGGIYPWVLYYRGWSHYRNSRFDRAFEDFSRLADSSGEAADGSLPFGELTGSADLNTLKDGAAYLAGWSAFQLGDFSRSGRYFLQAGTGTDQARYMYARSLAESGETAAAIAIFDELSRRSGTSLNDDALFEMAELQGSMGDFSASQNSYLELFRRFPQSPLAEESLYKRGENYMTAQEWEKATEAFYLSRQSFPQGTLAAAAHYWGGEAAYRSGENFGAVLLWERLISDFPGSPFRPVAIQKTADAYAARGDYTRALNLYLELQLSYPDEARQLGAAKTIETLKLLSHGESAETAELRAVITTGGGLESPESREAMLELAQILIYRGGRDREDGRLYLDELVFYKEEDLPRAARAQYYLGEYYFRGGQYGKAGEEYLKAAAMNPADHELMAMAILKAAEASLAAGRREDAQALVRRLEENFPQSSWAEEGRKLLGGAQ